MEKAENRLPGLLVNSYGFAYMTFTLMMSLALNYYAIFLTDVALITAAHMGTIMFITHFVDFASIPFSGSIIQKTQFAGDNSGRGCLFRRYLQPFFSPSHLQIYL